LRLDNKWCTRFWCIVLIYSSSGGLVEVRHRLRFAVVVVIVLAIV
jgi:hypothetical protein